MPIDLIFGINEEEGYKSPQQYAKKKMKKVNDIATKTIKKTTARGKINNDQTRQSSVLFLADRGLVRNMSECGGPGKFRSHWEEQIHIVVSQKWETSPVYDIKHEQETGRGRILHRNMSMPCHALLLGQPVQCSVGGQKPQSKEEKQTETRTHETSDDSESSYEEEHYWTHRLRHHHHSHEPDVAPPVTPELVHQP